MSDYLKVNDVFTYKNDDYIALDREVYNEDTYFFTNKLIGEEEPGKEFYVFKVKDDRAFIETNKEILDKLYIIFSERFNKKLETISDNH